MSGARRIRWKWIVIGAFLAEVTVMAFFFLLLWMADAAGVPEIAQPMTPLDYIDAMVMSFVSMFVFAIWIGKRLDSGFVLHGALMGGFGALLFTVLWTVGTGTFAQPTLYVVAHGLKIVGGIAGGLIAQRRHRRALAGT